MDTARVSGPSERPSKQTALDDAKAKQVQDKQEIGAVHGGKSQITTLPRLSGSWWRGAASALLVRPMTGKPALSCALPGRNMHYAFVTCQVTFCEVSQRPDTSLLSSGGNTQSAETCGAPSIGHL